MTKRLVGVAMFLAVTALSVQLAAAATRAAKPSAAPLKYELAFEHPNTHLLDVTIHASDLKGATVEFAIPDWAPGSYYIENYSANVQRFRATSADGKALSWRKTDSQTWQIDLAGATAVTISYQVFANTLQNNIAQYNERHAFIGGPSVWMYLVDGKDRPIELSVAAPSGWKIATGMEHTSDHTFACRGLQLVRRCPFRNFRFRRKRLRSPGHHLPRHCSRRRKQKRFHQICQRPAENGRHHCSPVSIRNRHAPGCSF